MKYTFSNRLKISSYILMVLGIIGLAIGFMNQPHTEEEALAMVASAHGDGHGGHGDGHADAANGHDSHSSSDAHYEDEHAEGHDTADAHHDQDNNKTEHAADAPGHDTHGSSDAHHEEEHSGAHEVADSHHNENQEGHAEEEKNHDAHGAADVQHEDGHSGAYGEAAAHHEEGHGSHGKHVLHQLQNRPWAALYVATFFFFMIALGVLAFYAINRAAQAGWSPILFRIMEGITAYLLPGGIIMFVVLAISAFHLNHLFTWADPEVVAHDKLIQGKAGYMNSWGVVIRAIIFLGGWIGYRQISRKLSLAQDKSDDDSNFKKNFKWSAVFLVFYLISESMMSWDWIMSFDPHWFSTLFGWYVFASMFVSGITTIAIITIYLKSKGYLKEVNNSHIHDLAKFMFGISIFWTYLWFSQFMLIWYADIPEEVTYYVTRIEHYKLPFFGMLVLNFIFPLLVLMNSDYKRINWFVIMTGIIILFGHYLDIYNMVMPATVGENWHFGFPEIGGILFFAGLFIYVVFTTLTKEELTPKRNPFLEESRQFHY